jgi:hypothetical protein
MITYDKRNHRHRSLPTPGSKPCRFLDSHSESIGNAVVAVKKNVNIDVWFERLV